MSDLFNSSSIICRGKLPKVFFLLLVFSFNITKEQVYNDKTAKVEDRMITLLSEMTLEEKLDYIG